MKVPRSLIGRVVECQWMDPTFSRLEMREIRKGRAALSTWREYGVIHDITDGVVLIVHSAATLAGGPSDVTDEVSYTPIPESLIEKLTVFEPVQPAKEERGDAVAG